MYVAFFIYVPKPGDHSAGPCRNFIYMSVQSNVELRRDFRRKRFFGKKKQPKLIKKNNQEGNNMKTRKGNSTES
jgi:hypothetical protein